MPSKCGAPKFEMPPTSLALNEMQRKRIYAKNDFSNDFQVIQNRFLAPRKIMASNRFLKPCSLFCPRNVEL